MEMQEVLTILNDWRWPILVFVLVLILVPIFKSELSELIRNTKRLVITRKGVEIDFANEIKQAKAQAEGIEREVASSGIMPSAERTLDLGDPSARGIILESWGSLKQVVFDACLTSGLALTPTTGIDEALRRLGEAKTLRPEFSSLVNVLNRWGDRLAHDAKIRPPDDAAREYKKIAYDLADWLMLHIVSQSQKGEPSPAAPPPPRRPTAVSDFFPQPKPGSPAAIFDGIGGVVRGKRFPIEKEIFRIGRDSDNDLSILGDDFVSGRHASLRYQGGSLLLSDDGSRNGTFLNEKQVTGTAVRRGDQIRIGNAVFQVSAGPPSQWEKKTTKDERSEVVG